jgi:hypothetical protein
MVERGFNTRQAALPKEAASPLKVVAGQDLNLCTLVAPGLETSSQALATPQ